MYILVGLGNPGNQYKKTRHNAGFLVIDYLFDILKKGSALKQNTLYNSASVVIQQQKILLIKPTTFMNLSGKAVKKVIDEIKYTEKQFDPSTNLFVIHDDVDLPMGVVKFKQSGSSAGHNGISNIISLIGNDFCRLRIGVDRPSNSMDTADYVLQNFIESEWNVLLNDVCPKVEKFFNEYFLNGINKARNILKASNS